jgi:hypothetical protein
MGLVEHTWLIERRGFINPATFRQTQRQLASSVV